jgi:hypothetical protein
VSGRRRGVPAKLNIENSWLQKSIEERLRLLRHLAPAQADAVEVLVNAALRGEWERLGRPEPGQ